MKIVVTGETGSGKTTILKATKLDHIYFADNYVKLELYKYDHQVFNEIKRKLPEAITEKRINKEVLGRAIFSDRKIMDWINQLIEPYLIAWINSLPKGSVVEMATYANLETLYSKVFDYVILITKKNPSIDKLKYLGVNNQPINVSDLKFDGEIINQNGIKSVSERLSKLIFKFRENK